jgi:hypothetical protein
VPVSNVNPPCGIYYRKGGLFTLRWIAHIGELVETNVNWIMKGKRCQIASQ